MRVLIVDDEDGIRKTTGVVVRGMGHEVEEAASCGGAKKALENTPCDVAFLDLKLPDGSGLNLLPALLQINPELEVIVFTAHASIDSAVEAMRRGAVDYIAKPFTPDQVRQVLSRAQTTQRLKKKVADLEEQLGSDSPTVDMSTEDRAMSKVLERASKAAATPASILILGESGTGKSVLARAIHQQSAQKERPFVTVSCPSLSRELLESDLFGHMKGSFTGAVRDTWGKVAKADGGTLFLDEIGEVPMEIQPKLLRLLQEREYERVGETVTRTANVRVIAASNQDMEKAIQEKRFREDLFYRLNVITLYLPALRERPGDMRRMADNYLKFFAGQCRKSVRGFSEQAMAAMERYGWPGNLRELRNAVEHAVIITSGPDVDASDLPEKITGGRERDDETGAVVGQMISLEELEKEHIRLVMSRCRTMEQAARVLGIDQTTLYRKRKRQGLDT